MGHICPIGRSGVKIDTHEWVIPKRALVAHHFRCRLWRWGWCKYDHLQQLEACSQDDIQFNQSVIGYEPADLTVHPPPQNDRGWVHFFAQVSSATKFFSPKKKVDFVGDIRIRTHKTVVLRHNHSSLISTRLTLFDSIE